MFKCGSLYLKNLESTADIVVNQGGTSSGKTYSIIQALFSIAIREADKVITVVGQDVPNLKRGALRDALSIVASSDELKGLIRSYNATDRIFTFHSGTIMEFVSFQTAQDAKGGRRDYLFINECDSISWEIIVELAMMGRTRIRTFMDYNPNSRFWVHDNIIGRPDAELIISDHRANPFLSSATHDKIEALKEVDEELWRVYARGYTGKITGLIFRNWDTVKELPAPASLVGHALDFGYTNDPTACVSVFKMDNELYVRLNIYETGLTNDVIAQRLKEININSCIADSAEPKSIQELRNNGVFAEPANKGRDSVNASIDILKRYKIHLIAPCNQLEKEMNSYKWRVDKVTGNTINEPVDFNNHAIDALRYLALNKLANNNSGQYFIR